MEKEITTNEIMGTLNELVEFLQENMTTKADIRALETRLYKKIDSVEIKLERKIEGLDSKFTVELRYITNELEEIKIELAKLDRRVKEDIGTVVKDNLKLHRRVDMLEKKIRQLQSAR
jgi:5-bromo-4-chloroindolyl phosphate hydrolysis protein